MAGRRGWFTGRDSDGSGTSPQDARLALLGILPAVGVLNGLAVTGSTSGSNMKYTVGVGTAVCARGTAASDGVYLVPNDGDFLADSGAPAPASGTRWDIIWVQARNTLDGFADPSSLPLIGVTVGVAAASSPVKPYAAGSGAGGLSVPAGALVLAESLVGTNIANASLAAITPVAPRAHVRGGIMPVSGSAFYPANPSAQRYIDDATLGLLRWNGTAWLPPLSPLRMQANQSASSNLTNATWTKILNLAVDFDGIGLSAAASAFTLPSGSGGRYELSGRVSFSGLGGSGASFIGAAVYRNGASIHAETSSPVSSFTCSVAVPPDEIALSDGDVIDLRGYVNGTGVSTVVSGANPSYTSYLRIKRVG